jgi:hypothetical protein
MAQVPVSMQVVVYPRDKSVKPYPATICGFAWITGLKPGGAPMPGGPGGGPPLEIWGDIGDYIDAGLPLPQPPPAIPTTPTEPKPPPANGGWGWSPDYGWGYFPPPGSATPKRP